MSEFVCFRSVLTANFSKTSQSCIYQKAAPFDSAYFVHLTEVSVNARYAVCKALVIYVRLPLSRSATAPPETVPQHANTAHDSAGVCS